MRADKPLRNVEQALELRREQQSCVVFGGDGGVRCGADMNIKEFRGASRNVAGGMIEGQCHFDEILERNASGEQFGSGCQGAEIGFSNAKFALARAPSDQACIDRRVNRRGWNACAFRCEIHGNAAFRFVRACPRERAPNGGGVLWVAEGAYHCERQPMILKAANFGQPVQMRIGIPAHPAITLGRSQQSTLLVKANGVNAHRSSLRKLSDSQSGDRHRPILGVITPMVAIAVYVVQRAQEIRPLEQQPDQREPEHDSRTCRDPPQADEIPELALEQ